MTLLLIVWTVTQFDCPFGLAKAKALRPFLCSTTQEKRWKLTSYPEEVKRLVQTATDEGDPHPLVVELTKARTREVLVTWEPKLR